MIIPAQNDVRNLQGLLAALVPAAVDGLVREVLVADGGSSDGTDALCEDAGAVRLEGGLVQAARAAKGARLLILPSALRLPHDWARSLAEHLERGGGDAVVIGAGERGLFKRPLLGLLVEASRIATAPDGTDIAAIRGKLRRPATIR